VAVAFTLTRTRTTTEFPSDIDPRVERIVHESTDGILDRTVRYFDRDGRECDRHGVVAPARPDSIPATARWFSTDGGGWNDGAQHRLLRNTKDGRCGVWRYWSMDGRLRTTERYLMSGVLLQASTPEAPDLIADAMTAFIADPTTHRDRIHSMARDPETRSLFARSFLDHPAALLIYVDLLERGVDLLYRSWPPSVGVPHPATVSLPAEVLDLVDLAPTSPELCAVGVRAALRLRDRKHVARWWKHVSPRDVKPMRVRAEQLLSKKPLLAAKAAAKLGDEALEALAKRTLGSSLCEIWIRESDSGEAWLLDSDTARTWHWIDGNLEPSRITIDVVRWGEHLHVAEASRCDERTFAWTSKHRWRLGQRYGSNVLWQCGERTQFGVNVILEQVWLLTRSPREATRILTILIDGLDSADPFRKKNLPLLRSYQGVPGRMGVDDTAVADPLETRVLEQHDSHAAAIAAFDRLELERFRRGECICTIDVASR